MLYEVITPDYSSLNIDFFKHLDKVIAEMHNNEIVSHLMIYVWNKRVAWPKAGSEADNMYYKHVIKRYQAFPNVIWDVSKDRITSYNVCYTKLLRGKVDLPVFLQQKLDAKKGKVFNIEKDCELFQRNWQQAFDNPTDEVLEELSQPYMFHPKYGKRA